MEYVRTIYLKSNEGLVKIARIRESAASAPVGSSSDEARVGGLPPPIVYCSRRTSPYVVCSIALSTYLERIICQIEISILVFSSCAACSVQTYVD